MKLLERTAYHEAGHAVANCLLRVPFVSVSIVRTEETLGNVSHGMSTPSFLGDEFLYDPRAVRRARKLITVLHAGQIAEWIASGRRNPDGASADNNEAVDLALRLAGNGEEATALLKDDVIAAEKLIRESWNAVSALAEYLLEHKTVGAQRARRLIRDAL
jgi:hypothetical protein